MMADDDAVAPSDLRALVWQPDHLLLLDQRRLPAAETWLRCASATEVATAIRAMVVRGAPAIGIAAAYGFALAAMRGDDLAGAATELAAARPTAVNLAWALRRMRALAEGGADAQRLIAEAENIHAEDVAINQRIGAYGSAWLRGSGGVLTHCNTGSLATGGHGTALGVIRTAWAAGRLQEVWAGETRPWLQGARLTAWELARDGIPARVLVDGAAGLLLQRESIQAVIVGADRVAANGDVANKIGTHGLAVLARYHGVPFCVAAPTSTIDLDTPDGSAIPIEERPGEEILDWAGERRAPATAHAWNPVFDITPAELVDALITERGVVETPSAARLARHIGTT